MKTNKLKDIAMIKGINMKDLSKKSNVPYTTLLRYAKTEPKSWQAGYLSQLATALGYNDHELIKQLQKPVLLPFVKWVGGKRQLLPELIKYAPQQYGTYFEPFVGGGALLFKLAPKKAVINDFNEELTNTYQVLRDEPDALFKLLKQHQENDSKDYYLKIRAVDRNGDILKMTHVERAARFIYMNKAGFNGLWRVNQKGQNNVPYGGHKHLNLVPDFLIDDSKYLGSAAIQINTGDYKDAVKSAVKNDFVYFDPPYIPVTPTSAFTSYTKDGFGLVQQEELAKTATELAHHGVKVMLSNSDVPLIHQLYSDPIWTIHHVQASRSINSNAQKRGKVGEVIITSNNY